MFASLRSRICHIFAMWRGVVVSRRCTNVWLGRLVVYVCQQNSERGEEGGGPCMGPLVLAETWEQETHAPHFLSPLYQHLALCYFCSLKASDESLATDKCLCFLWASNDWLYPPAPLLHSLFCSIPVSALRCHKRSYSLWFTLRLLRDGLGTPERTMRLLVLLKEWIFTRHRRKGMRDCELLTILNLSLLCNYFTFRFIQLFGEWFLKRSS